MTSPRRAILAYGLAFFLVTSVTIFWTRFSGGLALVWPGTAIATAMYLNLPRSQWLGPTILLVALSASATSLFGFGPGPAIPLAIVNVFEALLAASAMIFLRPQRDYIDSGKGVFYLALGAGVLGPAMASLPGGLIASSIVGGSWVGHAASWIAGHGLGTVLVLPLTMLLLSYRRRNFAQIRDASRVLQFLAVVALTLGGAALAIFQPGYPLLFLPIVPLVLACFLFGRLGASTGVLVVMLVAAVSLGSDRGVFAELDLPLASKALFLQFYLAVLILICLPTAVALKQNARLMAELSDREALQRLIADHSDDALLHLDGQGRITFASPASEKLSGIRSPRGCHLGAFFGEQDRELVEAALARARDRAGRTEIVERSVSWGDTSRWLEAKIQAVGTGGSANSFVVTIRDVTARKLEELQATREARTDALTGLPNRRAFLDRIERQLANAESEPFVLALIDLDHFKRVNDGYGHETGDKVLNEIAAIMRGVASPTCFFARLGGEEFGLIATQEAAEGASIVCEQLRLAIQRHKMADGRGGYFSVTTSIGMARIAEECSPSAAMSMADAPLYAAKASGRNCLRDASRPKDWGNPVVDEPTTQAVVAAN